MTSVMYPPLTKAITNAKNRYGTESIKIIVDAQNLYIMNNCDIIDLFELTEYIRIPDVKALCELLDLDFDMYL